MPPHNDFWTAERISTATRMWMEGAAGHAIGAVLGTSRSAVLGKLSRLGLMRKGVENSTAKPRSYYKRSKPKAPSIDAEPRRPMPRLIPLTPPPERGDNIGLTDLIDGMCKFPLGDPDGPDFRFCGHAQRPGAPYCPYHCQIAYSPRSEARKPGPDWRGRSKIPTSLLRYV